MLQPQKVYQKQKGVAPTEKRRVIQTLFCRISNVIVDNKDSKKSFVVITPLRKTGINFCSSITCTLSSVMTPRKKLKRGTPIKAFRIHFIPKKGWRAGGAIVLDGKK